MSEDRKKFEKFLAGINLDEYREKYKPIKIVEMDLDREVISVYYMIEVYWNQRKFPSFDEFYKDFLDKYKEKLETFRKKVLMCKDCYYLGMEARVYRTWASVLTQIQSAFVAEDVFGKGNVNMTGELDVERSVDYQIKYKGKTYNVQIKKITQSREVRAKRPMPRKPVPGTHIKLSYLVWKPGKTTHDKKGTPRVWYTNSQQLFAGKRLTNGFIIFSEEYLEDLRKAIDENKLKERDYLLS